VRSPDPPDPGLNRAPPTVLFVDLNSAFASIEQQYRPELRGLPVAVCPGAARASAVISASREARALGVRTLMRVHEALRHCPELVVVEPDARKYREVSRRLLRLLDTYSPRVLPLSIDEAAVDLAGTPSLRRDLRDVGREVKRRLRDEVGDWLTCSIGFSTNVFLAKQAAELEKPDGLHVIDHRNLVDVLARLRLTDLTGISEANAVRLRRAGIATPLQFLHASQHALRRQAFGSIVGEAWYLRLRGFETGSFGDPPRRSVSHSHVLPAPADPEEVRALVLRFCDRLGGRLRRDGLVAGRTELVLRTAAGESRQEHRRHGPTCATPDLYAIARGLWERMDERRPARFVALALSELSAAAVSQLDLFEEDERRSDRVSAVLDEIRDRFGDRAVVLGSLLNRAGLAPDRVAFGRLPPGQER
jgi:DNA polymerase-4